MLLAKRILITTLLIPKAKCFPTAGDGSAAACPHFRPFEVSPSSSNRSSTTSNVVVPNHLRGSNHHIRAVDWEEGDDVVSTSLEVWEQHASAATDAQPRRTATEVMDEVDLDQKRHGAKLKNWLFAGACMIVTLALCCNFFVCCCDEDISTRSFEVPFAEPPLPYATASPTTTSTTKSHDDDDDLPKKPDLCLPTLSSPPL